MGVLIMLKNYFKEAKKCIHHVTTVPCLNLMFRSALELTTQHMSAEYSAESIMEKQENIADKGL